MYGLTLSADEMDCLRRNALGPELCDAIDRASGEAFRSVCAAFANGAEVVTLMDGDREIGKIWADGRSTSVYPYGLVG